MAIVQWSIDLTTVVVVVGWATTAVIQSYRFGRYTQAIDNRFDGLEKKLAGHMDDVDETRGSHDAAIAQLRSEIASHRETSAERFATKADLDALERRAAAGQERVIDRIEALSGRIEGLSRDVLQAVTALKQ